MPFVLKSARGTFKRDMDVILATTKWQFSLVHLDDIIIFLKSPSEHDENVRHRLCLISDAGVTLNLKKCSFFNGTVNHLRYVICPKKQEVAVHTFGSIQNLRELCNTMELRPFISLCNAFRRLKENFARIANPVHKKPRKKSARNIEDLTDEKRNALKPPQERLI